MSDRDERTVAALRLLLAVFVALLIGICLTLVVAIRANAAVGIAWLSSG